MGNDLRALEELIAPNVVRIFMRLDDAPRHGGPHLAEHLDHLPGLRQVRSRADVICRERASRIFLHQRFDHHVIDIMPTILAAAGVSRYYVNGDEKLPSGAHRIVYDDQHDGGLGKGGTGTIELDGKVVGTARIERTLPFRLSLDETLDCGEDTGTPVSEDYAEKMPFKFAGELKQAVIKLPKN